MGNPSSSIVDIAGSICNIKTDVDDKITQIDLVEKFGLLPEGVRLMFLFQSPEWSLSNF
jgi:hypothetical protein